MAIIYLAFVNIQNLFHKYIYELKIIVVKWIFKLGLLLVISGSVLAQNTNYNKINTVVEKSDLIKLSQLPEINRPQEYSLKSLKALPYKIDNSEHANFRPVFMQYGWSCNQSASIGYMFTYELNAKRMRSASLSQNQYPFRFVWNFLNEGVWQNGVSYFDSWEIIKAIGCPSRDIYNQSFDYSESEFEYTQWMSGYSNYYSGMNNRIYDLFTIKVGTADGLFTLKQWINDHLDNSPNGGVANFQIASTGMNIVEIPPESEESGMEIITSFGEYVGHAMTFVGYNDSVKYDLNNDGEFTNDKDINNDGMVNMSDWEIGAMVCINSWGDGWPPLNGNGKVYVMYRLLAESVGKGGIWNNAVNVIKARTNYRPKLTMKVGLRHNYRGKIKLSAGVSSDINSAVPDNIIDIPILNYQGGNNPMCGFNQSEDIEVGIDITPLLSFLDRRENARFFLIIDEDDPLDRGNGMILNFSIIDYNGAIREITCSETNVEIKNDGRTLLSIDESVNFDELNIMTEELPPATISEQYQYQMQASGGEPPYKWYLKMDYSQSAGMESFPYVSGEELIIDNDPHYGYVKQELDFDFPFYGKYYDYVYVSGDGALLFDDNIFVWPYVIDEELVLKNQKAISAFGTDMHIYMEEGDRLYYDGNNLVATFFWNATIDKFQNRSDANFIVRLYKDGKIEFIYGDVNSLGVFVNWVGGISNGDGVNYEISDLSNSGYVSASYKTTFIPGLVPLGLDVSEGGTISGKPEENNKSWDLEFIVKDQNSVFDSETLKFTIGSTGVYDNYSNSLLKLSNYPNPFSLQTNISFVIPESSQSTLDVFNTKGQLIRTLKNEYLIEGQYNFLWNADTFHGKKVPAGIYYIRLVSGKMSAIRKMLVN